MDGETADIVMPTEPGLHLLVDRPQGQSLELLSGFAASALERGMPVIAVLLDQATPQFKPGLSRRGLAVAEHEEAGMLRYVDAFSIRVGWAHTDPWTVFVEDNDPDSILLGLSEAQAGIVERAPDHLILVDAFSSLLVLQGLPPTYAFGQSLASLAPRLGAVTVGRAVAGMHPREEMTALLNLASTVTDLAPEAEGRARPVARDPRGWR